MAREIYTATHSFVAQVGGQRMIVKKGDTVRAGHPMLKGNEGFFTRFEVKYETASAPDGERKTVTRRAK